MKVPCALVVSARKRSSASMAPDAQADAGPRARTAASANARQRRAGPAILSLLMAAGNAFSRCRLTAATSVVVAGVARREDIAVAIGRHLRDQSGLFHLLEQA